MIRISVEEIISDPNYDSSEYIADWKTKNNNYYSDDLQELAAALTKQTYEYYANNCINKNNRSMEILVSIKHGHIPDKYEIFELMCDDYSKIEKYTKMEKLKDKINYNKAITREDFDFLCYEINIDEIEKKQIIVEFEKRGLFINEYQEDSSMPNIKK